MNPTQQTVTKEQLEIQLRYAEVELACWIKHLEAHQARGQTERLYLAAMWDHVNNVFPLVRDMAPVSHHPQRTLEEYLDAHQADYLAKAELIKLNLAKLQSNVDQLKQILLKIDQQVVVPGSFQV
jgi:hypothetical protein